MSEQPVRRRPRLQRQASVAGEVSVSETLQKMREQGLTSVIVFSLSGNTKYLITLQDIAAYFVFSENHYAHLAPVKNLSGTFLALVLETSPAGFGDPEDTSYYWEVESSEALAEIIEKQCYYGTKVLYDTSDPSVLTGRPISLLETLDRVHALGLALDDTLALDSFTSSTTVTISDTSTVFQGLKTLFTERQEALLVVDEDDNHVGCFTCACIFDLIDLQETWPVKLNSVLIKDTCTENTEEVTQGMTFGQCVDVLLQNSSSSTFLWFATEDHDLPQLVSVETVLSKYLPYIRET